MADDKNGKSFVEFTKLPVEEKIDFLYLEILGVKTRLKRTNLYTILAIIVFLVNFLRTFFPYSVAGN